MLKLYTVLIGAVCSGLSFAQEYSSSANTSGYPVSQSDFGGTGLIQMPTARMDNDGAFYVNGFFNEEYYRYSLALQLFPWLETTIRYTDTRTQLFSNNYAYSGDQTHKDKGIDAKFRLTQEDYYIPEISLGVRDMGGTGKFTGEYLIGNKRWGPVDVSFGLGWGYLGSSATIDNPLCSLNESYCERLGGYSGNGGSFDFDRMFKGDAALIGGIEYQTPYAPLSLKLEYDGNDYDDDFAGDLPQDTPYNLGLVYRVGNWGDLHLSYERGNTLSLGFSLKANFSQLVHYWVDQKNPEYTKRAEPSRETDWEQVAEALDESAGFKASKIYDQGNRVTLIGEQKKYRDEKEGQRLTATVLASNTAAEVSQFQLIEESSRLAVIQTNIDVDSFENYALETDIGLEFSDSVTTRSPELPKVEPVYSNNERYDIGFAPKLLQSVGSAETFYFYSLGLNGSASAWLSDHLQLSSGVYFNATDNYDEFNYIVANDGTLSNLPRVRTLARDYLDEPVRITNLQLTWLDSLADNIYGQLYAGYLESMFGGVGGELLYRELGSPWAVGLDLNWVKQRDPNSALGFFDDELQYSSFDKLNYLVVIDETVGNLALYYQMDNRMFGNSLIKLSAGRYLAGDHGMTLDFSRKFDSGIILGAYATKTNLSADEYGEGSFTKGFYVSVPFDLTVINPTKSRASLGWQPLTRDGGQQLSRSSKLYNVTDARFPWYGN